MRLFRTRKRKLIAVAVAALVIIPGAIAGWVIYTSTASGTASGKITSSNTNADVVTFVANVATPAIQPSFPVTPTALVVTATNNGTAPEKLATLPAPTITDDATAGHAGTCAAAVHFNTATAISDTVTTPIPVGTTTYTFPNVITADNSMEGYCGSPSSSGSTITFTFAGATTNP